MNRVALSRALLGLALVLGLAFALPLPSAADALRDGKDALAAGRVDDAVAAYRNAVQATPTDPQAHLGLGLALEKKRSWQAALAEFQKASELDPRLADPLRGVGAMQLRLGNPTAAEAAFRKAVEIDRKFPEATLGLGDALTQLKRYDESVAVLQQGIKFGPKTEMMFFSGLGRANEARPESLKAAEVWFLRARQSAEGQNAPNSVKGPIYRDLGDLYMKRKIPSLAIQNYQQAKAIDETDLDTRMALGDAYYKGQLYNDALAEYKAVVDADPEYEDGYLKLGNLYYLASFSDPQRVFQAIEVLEKLMVMNPNHLEGKAILAQAYFRKGGADGRKKATDLLDEIEKSGKPFPPEAWRTRAIIQYESREYQNAINSFAKAPKLEPIDQFRLGDAYKQLAAAAADTVQKAAFYDSADVIYKRIVDADSTTADAKRAQLERARLLYQRKDYVAAVREFQHVIALDPKACEAYYFLGLSQRAQGDDTSGIASLEQATACDGGRAAWWLQLGAGYSKLKQDDKARAAFEKAAVDTATTGSVAWQQIGYQDLLAKRYAEAIKSLEESVRRDPKQLMSWVWLGQARQNSGDRAGAIEAYHKALEIKPGQPDAMKGLKSLGAQ